MKLTLFAACGVAACCVSTAALAQTDGSIRGYIHDEQGAALPGVTITATSPAAPTPVNAVTDEQGFYRLLNMAPGTYSVTAEPGARKPDGAAYTPTDLRSLQDWIIRPQLRQVAGVSEVNSIGGDSRFRGVDAGAYPRARVVNVGITLGF